MKSGWNAMLQAFLQLGLRNDVGEEEQMGDAIEREKLTKEEVRKTFANELKVSIGAKLPV